LSIVEYFHGQSMGDRAKVVLLGLIGWDFTACKEAASDSRRRLNRGGRASAGGLSVRDDLNGST